MGRVVDLADKLRPELVVTHARAEEMVGAGGGKVPLFIKQYETQVLPVPMSSLTFTQT